MERIVTLEIDGKEVKAKEGATILEAVREAGIEIPTLCYNEKLLPYGACRICSVEVVRGERARIVASCGYPVEEGLEVKTRSPKVDKIRRTIIELIAPLLGEIGIMGEIKKLAEEYGANISRFTRWFKVVPTRCILCGLCTRYCSEVVGENAVGFIGTGIDRKVVFYPEKIGFCQTCRACFELCPTGKIPSETDGVSFAGLTIRDHLPKKTKGGT